MKFKTKNGKITCKFRHRSEKELLESIIKRHINLMGKGYRKKNANWVIVSHLTGNGSGYSCAICKALNVNPSEYEWVK